MFVRIGFDRARPSSGDARLSLVSFRQERHGQHTAGVPLQSEPARVMRVTIRSKYPVRNRGEIKMPRFGYPLRVSSFFLSVGTHCLGIAALMFVSFPGGQPE